MKVNCYPRRTAEDKMEGERERRAREVRLQRGLENKSQSAAVLGALLARARIQLRGCCVGTADCQERARSGSHGSGSITFPSKQLTEPSAWSDIPV